MTHDPAAAAQASGIPAEDFQQLADLLSGGPSETLLKALLSNNVNPIIAALRIAAHAAGLAERAGDAAAMREAAAQECFDRQGDHEDAWNEACLHCAERVRALPLPARPQPAAADVKTVAQEDAAQLVHRLDGTWETRSVAPARPQLAERAGDAAAMREAAANWHRNEAIGWRAKLSLESDIASAVAHRARCQLIAEVHETSARRVVALPLPARPQPAAAEVEAVAQEATEDESLQARYKALARCYVAQGDLCRELLAQISALRPDTQTAAADVKTAALDLWAKLDTEIDPPGVLDHEQAVKIIGALLRDNGSAQRPATLADVPSEVQNALKLWRRMFGYGQPMADEVVAAFVARLFAAQEKPDAG